jgi:hypothetical protein
VPTCSVPALIVVVLFPVWALIALLFGSYIFLSRERDFAVRI